jgi:hypothetical protein
MFVQSRLETLVQPSALEGRIEIRVGAVQGKVDGNWTEVTNSFEELMKG